MKSNPRAAVFAAAWALLPPPAFAQGVRLIRPFAARTGTTGSAVIRAGAARPSLDAGLLSGLNFTVYEPRHPWVGVAAGWSPPRTRGDLDALFDGRAGGAGVFAPTGAGKLAEDAARLEKMLKEWTSTREAGERGLRMLAELSDSGRLRPVLRGLALKLEPTEGSVEKRLETAEQAADMIEAELCSRGLLRPCAGNVYESLEAAGERHLEIVRDTSVGTAGPGNPSRFLDPVFIEEFESLGGAPFRGGNSVRPLIDGPVSFALRDKLIGRAKRTIHVMSWAFYDDETGWDAARRLAAKAAEGVKVRVIVDGQVGARKAHDDTLKFMENNGVEVIRWKSGDPARPYDGTHRKLIVVDGAEAVAGGMNIGDEYSHRGPAGAQKWRDTDVYLAGPSVLDAQRLFARAWNEFVGRPNGPPYAAVAAPGPVPRAGDTRVSVFDHVPGKDENIMLATLKAIEGATASIDLEHCFFIRIPAVHRALLAALARGVRVRILTNSAASVEEDVVSVALLSSLPELIDAGAEVYLKRGDMLHSKFMIVDEVFASIGSYNLHPRSYRFEGEMTVNILEEAVARELTEVFENDIASAEAVRRGEDVEIPKSPLGHLAKWIFFDQL